MLVGINLLREGLDLPEVSLVAILDADKEGFLRSSTALIQTMGRASRHIQGTIIMYADMMTKSMKTAIAEVSRRRQYQFKYNQIHHLQPKSIVKPVREQLIKRTAETAAAPITINPDSLTGLDKQKLIKALTLQMHKAVKLMEFELAAKLRDQIKRLE